MIKFVLLLLIGLAQHAAQDCPTLKESFPRGIQCLHCTHPKAVASAQGLLQATLNSCQKNIAFGFVLDGSFGNNFEIINTIASSLIENNRQPYFHFYFLNGPAQRRYRDKVFPDSVFQINPYEFRDKIIHDQSFRNIFQFKLIISRIPDNKKPKALSRVSLTNRHLF